MCDWTKVVPHITMQPTLLAVVAWVRESFKLSVPPIEELQLARELVCPTSTTICA